MLYFFHHGAYYEASEPCLTSGYFTGKETQSTKITYTIICVSLAGNHRKDRTT